ncbi:rRNA processing protein-like protein Bystin [Xylogone sp. PMI_703]|nr:rRNA processing protein-like protein Bystin [Xylogone sp. PMI_703]
MPKATTPVSAQKQGRLHKPLEEDLTASGPLKKSSGKRKSRHGDEDEEKFVDSKASKRILRIGQELAEEERAEADAERPKANPAFDFESRFAGLDEEEEETYGDDEEAWGDEEEIVEEVELAPDDLETYSKFFPTQEDPLLRTGWGGAAVDDDAEEQGQGTNLADLILEKIAEHEAKLARQSANGGEGQVQFQGRVGPVDEEVEIHPKVVEVYTRIGILLSRFKSGKLPKPFKILPTVPNWETILQITRPDSWSPNAVYEATRIFISSTPSTAQKFLEMVVLDRVREDIAETKKLNVHLFNALKKGLYKPAAWFKGILFPLVASGTCTLREAHIISAVLVRVSIPVLHSAAAIKGLCDIAAQESSAGTEGGGATNIFIKALLEKKYALPYQVIDALVFHFLRFRSVDPASVHPDDIGMGGGMEGVSMTDKARMKESKLPVIWHQSLLAFATRYKNDISEDQREALLDLIQTNGHHSIGPEIRRELLAGRGRGTVIEPEGMVVDGDDTMVMDP